MAVTEGDLSADLRRLGTDLETGVEGLAAERGVSPERLLHELVVRALQSTPEIISARSRRWGALDLVAALALLGLLALAVRAGVVATTLEPPAAPAVEVKLREIFSAATTGENDLAGRTLLALPVAPASYALLGELPTRLSAAVVPGPPAEGAAQRPVHRLDDLLVLRAEPADGGLAVLAAVPEAELPALLEALPGATVHLLRPGPAKAVSNTPAPDSP